MQVWQKLLRSDNSIGFNREMLLEISKNKSHCPAGIEAAHHLIGDKRMKSFCKHGCSVNCVVEYLDLKVGL